MAFMQDDQIWFPHCLITEVAQTWQIWSATRRNETQVARWWHRQPDSTHQWFIMRDTLGCWPRADLTILHYPWHTE